MSSDTRVKETFFLRCQAINDLVRDSLDNEQTLKWIPDSEFSKESIQHHFPDRNFSYRYAVHERWGKAVLLLLGNDNECTPAFVDEFARQYSLPTHKYNNPPNLMEFRRYRKWLTLRNKMIKGFTKYDDNYYLVAERPLLYCYFRYGFCSACGILRCSPVWCICGYKELSDTWTSNNERLDNLIKKSQIQTNSANDAYLEWIPIDCIDIIIIGKLIFNYLPMMYVKLIPLE
jgi:hypothetical protein